MYICFLRSNYDLIVGNFNPNRSDGFTSTWPYIQDDMTWCVSRAQEIPHWQTLFYFVADARTRIIGFILFVICIVLAYLLHTFEKKQIDIWTAFLSSFQIVLGLTAPLKMKSMRLRFLYFMFLFIALLIVTTIVAFLTMFMTAVITYKQINSIQDIIDANLHLAGDSNILNHSTCRNLVE